MDLHYWRDQGAWTVLLPQMDWLVANYQRREGVTPDLAKAWDVSGDGTAYTFHLDSALWSDGSPVTAEDVASSLRRIAFGLGARPYQSTLASLDRVESLDNITVRLTLKRPDASFIAGLGVIGNVIYPSGYSIQQYAEMKPLASGPFVLSEFKPDYRIRLAKNNHYFKKGAAGRALPYLDGVDLFVIPDPITGYAAIRVGQFDLTYPADPVALSLTSAQAAEKLQDLTISVARESAYTVTFMDRLPWSNDRVRKAIEIGMDRHALVQEQSLGFGTAYSFLMPPKELGGKWGLQQEELMTPRGYGTGGTDIAPALQLLKLSGVDASALHAALKVREGLADMATGVADQLKKRLGISMEAAPVDEEGVRAAQATGDFDLLFDEVSLPLDDPSAALDPVFRSRSPRNYGRWNDAEVDGLLDKLAVVRNAAERRNLSEQLQWRLVDLAWTIEVGGRYTIQAWSPKVKGFAGRLNSQDGPAYRFEDVWLD